MNIYTVNRRKNNKKDMECNRFKKNKKNRSTHYKCQMSSQISYVINESSIRKRD